jgi:hypothetical protein
MLRERRRNCHGLHDRRAPDDPGDGARLCHEGGAADRQQARSGKGRHPARVDPEARRHGLFRHRHPRAVWRAGARRLRILPDHRGAGARLDERRQHHRPRQRLERRPRHDRRPARRLPAARRPRRVPRRGGDVGTRRRLRSRQHLLPRAQGRRFLGDQRQQILVHVRRRCRLHHAGRAHLRFARSQAQACRPLLLPDREAARNPAAGRQGIADPQDRLFRLEDVGTGLRQLPPARGGADRRGRPRLLLHLRRARAGARPHRGTGDRPGARRAGGCDGVRAGAAAVRPGDRRIPEHPLPARPHGDRDRGVAAADVLRVRRDRRQAALRQGGGDGEVPRLGDGRALQIFGGAGYTTLHAVERYWRDARLTKIFEGTSEIQQRIISDHLLGKPKAA